MALFLSTFTNKVDRKGRVSLPASFRAVLGAGGAQTVMVFPSLTLGAIEGCGPDILEALADSANATYDFFSPEQSGVGTQIFGMSSELSWDPEGRVLLPGELLDHAGIAELASFVGMGRSFQIWEPAALKAHQAEARSRLLAQPPKLTLRRPETT